MRAKRRTKRSITKKKNRILNIKRFTKLILLSASLVLISFTIFKLASSLKVDNPPAKNNVVKWKISVDLLPAQQAKNINLDTLKKVILSQVGKAQSTKLDKVAKNLQKKYQAKQVSLVHVSDNQLHVRVLLHQPIMVINADRLRFLSTDGAIYGTVQKNTKGYPKLSGVLSERLNTKSFNFLNGQLITSSREDILIKKSMAILKKTKEKGIVFKKISYNKNDGFLIENGKFFKRIIIGFSDFNLKIEKLSEILNRVKRRNNYAEKIELDYSGKAFVKEKPVKK